MVTFNGQRVSIRNKQEEGVSPEIGSSPGCHTCLRFVKLKMALDISMLSLNIGGLNNPIK